ncbi:hypothetical protein AAFC00_006302 [Neodothiora populina]|uniref:Uncharacterized protein n=1 Tax=Neodothiora populina TaxID=2781224 RepID=A0ABR3P548_9PEZI
MSAPSSMVYVNEDFSAPMSSQYNFSNQFDLDNPEEARMSYMRLMHEHTKHQFEMATSSAARRRASPAEHNVGGLRPETSNSSMESQ